jgi:hypothetical protein
VVQDRGRTGITGSCSATYKLEPVDITNLFLLTGNAQQESNASLCNNYTNIGGAGGQRGGYICWSVLANYCSNVTLPSGKSVSITGTSGAGISFNELAGSSTIGWPSGQWQRSQMENADKILCAMTPNGIHDLIFLADLCADLGTPLILRPAIKTVL